MCAKKNGIKNATKDRNCICTVGKTNRKNAPKMGKTSKYLGL